MLRAERPADRTDPPAGFATLLVLTMGAGPLALYGITALAPLLIAELGVTRAELGLLAGATFRTAAACSTGGGLLTDRISERLVTAGVLLGASLALGLVASATGFAWLVVAAVVSGAAQSLSNPVTNRLVSTHVPPHRLGTLVGVKQSGVQLAQLVAGALLPGVAAVGGRRTAAGGAALLVLASVLAVRWSVPATPLRVSSEPRRRGGTDQFRHRRAGARHVHGGLARAHRRLPARRTHHRGLGSHPPTPSSPALSVSP